MSGHPTPEPAFDTILQTPCSEQKETMKTLYFDINGTLVFQYECKSALVGGAFERTVRQTGFERLVCVSNMQNTVTYLAKTGQTTETLGIIFDLCWAAFCDRVWFLKMTALVPDPEHRVRSIDFAGDWWYLDDLAEEYLAREGMTKLFRQSQRRRVLAPDPASDGNEILDWLQSSH